MNHLSKAAVPAFIISIFLIPSASAEAPQIESMDVWPGEVNHNSDIYVEATVADTDVVSDIWFEVMSGSEKVAKASMFDTNDDNYYTSAGSFNVEGGQEYRVKVKACSNAGECVSQEKFIRPKCEIGFLGNCIY